MPADVGLFVEGQELDDLLLPFSAPQAWLVLAELAGQPARPEEALQWSAQVRQTTGMDPAEAIRLLFSQQFAFVARRPGRTQDGVVICRPSTDLRQLLERWQALPLPSAGSTPVYRLPDRIGAALPHGFLMLGDAVSPDGMFRHVLGYTDGRSPGASLAEDPEYAGLLARVPPAPDAILFARLQNPGGGLSGGGAHVRLPGPLRDARNILLALHRTSDRLHLCTVGDATNERPPGRAGVPALLERLPARTLAAWGLHLDYPELLTLAPALPERSLWRIVFKLQEHSGTLQRLAAGLGSPTCVALGVVEPNGRTAAAPPVPALALLVEVEDPTAVAEELDALLQTTVSVYNLMSLKLGAGQPLRTPRPVELEDTQASLLDLSELTHGWPGLRGAVAELHLCWALDGRTLIVASHIDWLRQILAARHEEGASLSEVLRLAQGPVAPTSETVMVLQAGPLADLGRLWLDYFRRVAPEILEEKWWRQRQPGGGKVRLGIQVSELPDERRLRVTSVAAGTPADGLLSPDDDIVGYGRQRFATSQPVSEVLEAIDNRPNARWIDLLIERGGNTLIKRIPLPFVDPPQLLRRAVVIGHIAQTILYHDDVPDEAGMRGYLTIELRQSPRQRFPFRLSPAEPQVGGAEGSSGQQQPLGD